MKSIFNKRAARKLPKLNALELNDYISENIVKSCTPRDYDEYVLEVEPGESVKVKADLRHGAFTAVTVDYLSGRYLSPILPRLELLIEEIFNGSEILWDVVREKIEHWLNSNPQMLDLSRKPWVRICIHAYIKMLVEIHISARIKAASLDVLKAYIQKNFVNEIAEFGDKRALVYKFMREKTLQVRRWQKERYQNELSVFKKFHLHILCLNDELHLQTSKKKSFHSFAYEMFMLERSMEMLSGINPGVSVGVEV